MFHALHHPIRAIHHALRHAHRVAVAVGPSIHTGGRTAAKITVFFAKATFKGIGFLTQESK